jgi:hypothetical protein
MWLFCLIWNAIVITFFTYMVQVHEWSNIWFFVMLFLLLFPNYKKQNDV